MRNVLIVCVSWLSVSILGCQSAATEADPVAARPQSKAVKEAIAAANAYYEKSTKDCGSYRYAHGSFLSTVAYKDAAKDARVEIIDGPNPYDGLEWRATGSLNPKAWSLIGIHNEIMGWRLTYGKGIPGEYVMLEKKNGTITYDGGPLSAVTPPTLPCQ